MFNITLSTFFRNNIIEDKGSVHAKFYVRITLLNDLYSSMTVKIDLDSNLRRYCDGFTAKTTVMDVVIIVLLIVSSIPYIASTMRTYRLAKDLKLHFCAFHKSRLRWIDELSQLFNKWYIFMLFTNTVIVLAIILKIVSEYKEEISIELVEAVRVLLGSGIFLLGCGLFGILSYVESLNVLFITIRLAIPSVLKFVICVLILFAAFVLCGWLVLGPYHPKFEDFSLSVESLFCILIGDDLYTTFEQAHSSTQSTAVKVFSEIYLVLFIITFIYAVLSVFIGIFNYAYENLSENWKEYSRGYVRDWAEGERDNDPTKSYPFPVPPVRNPATNIDSIQEDMGSSLFAVNTDLSESTSEGNPTIHVVEPVSNEQLHSKLSSHLNRLSSIKLLVAQPPVATRKEINDARLRLRGRILLNSDEVEVDEDKS